MVYFTGQERFESMTKAYFRNAAGALLVYDIGNRQSFENMKNRWLVQLREFGHENMFVIVVGNKSDMEPAKRKVTVVEAAEFAESVGLDFVETSARTGENVEIAFRRVIVSVASLLPGIKESIKAQRLPRGWIFVSDKKKYLNLWTGASTDTKPERTAETGLLVTTINTVADVNFRDSSS
jgi:50S ribosomal subunit-associated GTPase HflX